VAVPLKIPALFFEAARNLKENCQRTSKNLHDQYPIIFGTVIAYTYAEESVLYLRHETIIVYHGIVFSSATLTGGTGEP
jgi:hypothetical protein